MGQEQKKYHITDDGKIFSVAEDGSVTEVGDISDLGNNSSEEPNKPKKKSKTNVDKLVAIFCIIAFVSFLVCFFFLSYDNNNADYDSEAIDAAVYEEDTYTDSTPEEIADTAVYYYEEPQSKYMESGWYYDGSVGVSYYWDADAETWYSYDDYTQTWYEVYVDWNNIEL